MSSLDGKRLENYEFWLQQDQELLEHREEAYQVGGEKQLKRLAKQGKFPARQLVEMLIDPDTEFYELGLDAGYHIGYPEQPHIPGGGLVTGVGKIQGKDCMIFAN